MKVIVLVCRFESAETEPIVIFYRIITKCTFLFLHDYYQIYHAHRTTQEDQGQGLSQEAPTPIGEGGTRGQTTVVPRYYVEGELLVCIVIFK